jgi:uncharacterized membrane protein YgcG
MFIAWWRVGRDPAAGVIVPRYEPPKDHSPGGLRYVARMGYDARCFTGDVLSLAVADCLSIKHEGGTASRSWRLERTDPKAPARVTAAQRKLCSDLFRGAQRVSLGSGDDRISEARAEHSIALHAQSVPRYFRRNYGTLAVAAAIALATVFCARAVGGERDLAAAVVLLVEAAALVVFWRLIRAPTLEGRKLLDEIAGFKLYLSVAERDELARMKAPALNAERYAQLLPYAVALDVEEAWTAKLTAALGAAAAAAAVNELAWYQGSVTSNAANFSHVIGDGLSTTIASASAAPGSSSGFSGGSSDGGGSSGGGGGGGGGGGW